MVAKNLMHKYFDDGTVQYWRASDSPAQVEYRLTVAPSGITVDRFVFANNGRMCWQVAESGFASFEIAGARLLALCTVFMGAQHQTMVRETPFDAYLCRQTASAIEESGRAPSEHFRVYPMFDFSRSLVIWN